MAPRPKNPPPDRRAEILEAALHLFAERGYAAATNAQIARAAGVTPAALYYYFPSKADLFQAAITERRSAILPQLQGTVDQVAQLPPEVVLPQFIRTLVTFLSEPRSQALLRILLAEGPRNPDLVQIWQANVLTPGFGLLFGYLEQQMASGRIRRIDPRLVAIVANGPALTLILLRDLLGVGMAQDLTNEALIQSVSQMLLAGLATPEKE